MFLANGFLIGAICLIVGLVVLFIVTFLLNKKTPVPKGCEDLLISDENCSACSNLECSIKKVDFKKIDEELKEEEK